MRSSWLFAFTSMMVACAPSSNEIAHSDDGMTNDPPKPGSATPTSNTSATASVPSASASAKQPNGPWQNPFVLVEVDGVMLNVGNGTDSPAVHLQISELAARVKALPASAWPQGKQIGLQEAPIVGHPSDAATIQKNAAEVKKILEGLGLTVVPFPSG
jgi:hypothetical protein